MNDDIYDDMALEQKAKQLFGFSCDIDNVIARAIPVSPTSHATVFLTTKKQLMVFIDGQSRFTFAEVKKILNRMNLIPELFLPPKNQPHYFDDYGTERFIETFPGRAEPSAQDLIYYRTLAPYRPALVQLSEVKDGTIMKYDRDSANGWRVATKFAYRRIRTS